MAKKKNTLKKFDIDLTVIMDVSCTVRAKNKKNALESVNLGGWKISCPDKDITISESDFAEVDVCNIFERE